MSILCFNSTENGVEKKPPLWNNKLMELVILGSIGEIQVCDELHQKRSGVLVDNRLLFDLGEPEYLRTNPEAVFITHIHPDHAYFIREATLINTDIPMYAPESCSEHGADVKLFRSPFIVAGYKITSIPVLHARTAKSVGFLLEKDDKRVFYTGDVSWIKRSALAFLGMLDLVITEGSFINDKGRVFMNAGVLIGHTGIPNLITLFKDHTRNIVFTHLGSWFFNDSTRSKKQILALCERQDIEGIVSYDGLKITV